MAARAWMLAAAVWGCGPTEEAPDASEETDAMPVDSDTDDVFVDPCRVEPAIFRVGTGEAAFQAIEPGQVLEMVNGPQQGWHLEVAVEVQNAPQRNEVEVTITDIASGTVVSADDPLVFNVGLVASPLGSWQCDGSYPGLNAIFDFSRMGAEDGAAQPWMVMCGREARIDVVMKGSDGVAYASGSAEVVVQPDPANGPYCAPVADGE